MKQNMVYISIIIRRLFTAGTKDPIDMVDGLKLPLDLNITTRGKTADKY